VSPGPLRHSPTPVRRAQSVTEARHGHRRRAPRLCTLFENFGRPWARLRSRGFHFGGGLPAAIRGGNGSPFAFTAPGASGAIRAPSFPPFHARASDPAPAIRRRLARVLPHFGPLPPGTSPASSWNVTPRCNGRRSESLLSRSTALASSVVADSRGSPRVCARFRGCARRVPLVQGVHSSLHARLACVHESWSVARQSLHARHARPRLSCAWADRSPNAADPSSGAPETRCAADRSRGAKTGCAAGPRVGAVARKAASSAASAVTR
jgi:hypothetical protein